MYTVVVIDGRANGLPILHSQVLLTDCSGQHQSLRTRSRETRFVLIVSGWSPIAETNQRLRKVFEVGLQVCQGVRWHPKSQRR